MKRFLGRKDKTSQNQAVRKAANDDDEDEELLSPGLLDTVKPKAGRILAPRPASMAMATSPSDRVDARSTQSDEPLRHITAVNSPPDAMNKPASSLRKQTSYSSISNASTANSSASMRSGLPTVGGLPRPRTTSTASFTAPSIASSISASQSRRISSTRRDLPSLAQRSRTTSFTSPAANGNASFSASPNKRGSRVPVSSVSARRLGSVQSIRGLEATPRPYAKSQHGMTSANDESPGLEVLVANTTLSVQDLQETLSPLTSAISHQGRKDRRAEGSWISIDHDDVENINTPIKDIKIAASAQKSRQAVKSSTASINGGLARAPHPLLPKSLTNDGLPLPPSRSLQRKNLHSPVPLQPKVASQPVSKRTSGSQQVARTDPKASSDISDILDEASVPTAHESPVRLLATEVSTMAMLQDLSDVALTPIKPSSYAPSRASDIEGIRKELLEQAAKEKAVYETETKRALSIVQLAMDKQTRELNDLRAMLAKGAGTADRLAQLEAEHTSWKRQDDTSQRHKEEIGAQVQAAITQKQVFAQAFAIAKWTELRKDYATEQRELDLQKATLAIMKDMVSSAESQIRCCLLGQ